MATGFSGKELPLVVIVGPTASGKTSLAIELAEQFDGEIICADSRTVYRGMDIGTAKPTTAERARVPHWGLDLVEPDQRFTAADFKKYAQMKIVEIRARGHIPFLVGGTGLYVDAVLFDFQFGDDVDLPLRHTLEERSLEELYQYCEENNVELPENIRNKRYVIRAIERKATKVKRQETPISSSIIVGIATSGDVLRKRISLRSEQLFNNGVVREAIKLSKKYGWNNEAMTGNIYQIVRSYLEGDLPQADMKEKFTTLDWRLAKRQLTWLRRNPYIVWLGLPDARDYLLSRLANAEQS